jgi:hypothetical protein
VTVESSVDLPVIVAILFENAPQEEQLSLQTIFITENSDPMHHLFLQEPHGITPQKMAFFIVTTMKTSNLTSDKSF